LHVHCRTEAAAKFFSSQSSVRRDMVQPAS
jgi:hypothetical protein